MKPSKLKVWLLPLLFLLLAWVDYYWPLSDKLVHRAEPISTTALIISLSLSAAQFAVNRIFGPKPPKLERGKLSGDLFIQNSEEGLFIPDVFGAAPQLVISGITWTNLTNCTVQADNSLKKTAGDDNCEEDNTDTDGGARSVETITGEEWEVTWNAGSNTEGRVYGGLTSNAAFTANYNQLRHCIYVSDQNYTSGPIPPHSIQVLESGTVKATLNAAYTFGDTLRIRAVDGTVTYWHKETLLYTSLLTPVSGLFFAASIACLNKTIDDVVVKSGSADGKGGIKLAGNIPWAKQPTKTITREQQGGKGAPKQTVETTTYYTNLAIMGGNGPWRLKALWANADKILDLTNSPGTPTGVMDSSTPNPGTYNGIVPPGPGSTSSSTTWATLPVPDENGVLSVALAGGGGAALRVYEGHYEQLPDSAIQADVDAKFGSGSTPAYRGRFLIVFENFNISKYQSVPTFTFLVEHKELTRLGPMLDHLADRVGIEPGDRDFSLFDDVEVRGLVINSRQAPRVTMETLGLAYNVEYYESVDGILTGLFLGGQPQATRFDASEDVYSTSTDLPTFPNTFAFWVYIKSTGGSEERSAFLAINIARLFIGIDDDLNLLAIWDSGSDNLGPPLELDTWYHVAIVSTAGAGVKKVYLNGIEVISVTANAPASSDTLYIANNGFSQWFDGRICALKIWETALTQAEIQAEMATYSLIKTDSVWGHYQMQSAGLTLVDESGNGHNIPAGNDGGTVEDGPPISGGTGGSVVTIDPNHLGAVEGDTNFTNNEVPQLFDSRLLDEIQLPRTLNVTGFDPNKDYEKTSQPAYRQQGFAVGEEVLDLPMTFGPNELRRIAERTLYRRHVEFESGATTLPPVYGYVDAAKVVTVISEGITHRLRIQSIAGILPGALEFGLVADQLEVFNQFITGFSGGGYSNPTVQVPVESIALLLDIVNLRDEDNEPGYYAAITPRASGSWQGAVLYEDRGTGYEIIERFFVPAIAGTAVAALPDADPAVWDYTNTIDIDLYADGALENATEQQVLNGANAGLLGSEVIQWQTATKLGGFTNRWRLSNLLRGRRGSEYATSTHQSGERFVLLDAIRFISKTLADRGIATNFKAVTSGFALVDTASTSFTWDVQNLKPLSVVDVQGTRDGSNNLTITWIRRSRIGQETPYISGGDPPLGEETESYEIDVMDGVTVKRTITASSPTASYTAAEQTTDFGSPQASVTVKIYQMSARVGRGQVRQATV
jgi:concanavalin A-like lectin/glucanase superfamily protein/putative tail protein